MAAGSGAVRIGEFSRRVGVAPELLRAWERRYGLLQPIRSQGGFRLYTAADAERVSRMRNHLAAGLSAAEAARAALAEIEPGGALLEDALDRLLAAIRGYDEAAVHAVLDAGLAAFGLEHVIGNLLLPALARIGTEWESGTLAVGNEHFASDLVRGRLLALARLWARGSGPLALLACAPGEAHDLSLLAFGLLLRSYGWRVVFLGADTPVETLTEAATATAPALVVVTSFDPALLESAAGGLARLAEQTPLALAGPGASDAVAERVSAARLDGDLLAAAAAVARGGDRERYRAEKR